MADIDEDLAETVEDLAEGDNILENIEHNEDDYDEIVIPSLEQDPAFQSIQLNEVDLKIALMMDLMKKFIQLRKQEL